MRRTLVDGRGWLIASLLAYTLAVVAGATIAASRIAGEHVMSRCRAQYMNERGEVSRCEFEDTMHPRHSFEDENTIFRGHPENHPTEWMHDSLRPKARTVLPGTAPVKRAPSGKPGTYAGARAALLDYLRADGWTVKESERGHTMKIPHATSPDGRLRLWFKPQAIWFTTGQHTFDRALSSWNPDIRAMPPRDAVTAIVRSLKF